MTDSTIQNKIEAAGPNAPRVTPADIEAEIVSEHFFTALDGMIGAYHSHGGVYQGAIPSNRSYTALSLLTFCVLILKNGFSVTGESACVSPENFNAAVGRQFARQNAVSKVWPLLGFRLSDKLANPEA